MEDYAEAIHWVCVKVYSTSSYGPQGLAVCTTCGVHLRIQDACIIARVSLYFTNYSFSTSHSQVKYSVLEQRPQTMPLTIVHG